jgi:hypothetical protein
MKNILIAAVAFLLCIGTIKAQPNPPSVGKQLIHLKRILQLDDKQADKVKSILAASDAKLNELKDKIELAHKKQMEEMRKARQKDMEEMDNLIAERDDQITQVLNDSQKKKFDEFRDEQQMKSPEDGFPPPPQMMEKRNMPDRQGGCKPNMDDDKMNLPDDPNGPPNK